MFLWLNINSKPWLSTLPMFSSGISGKPRVLGMEYCLGHKISERFSFQSVKSIPSKSFHREVSKPISVFSLVSHVIFLLGNVLAYIPGASLVTNT